MFRDAVIGGASNNTNLVQYGINPETGNISNDAISKLNEQYNVLKQQYETQTKELAALQSKPVTTQEINWYYIGGAFVGGCIAGYLISKFI